MEKSNSIQYSVNNKWVTEKSVKLEKNSEEKNLNTEVKQPKKTKKQMYDEFTKEYDDILKLFSNFDIDVSSLPQYNDKDKAALEQMLKQLEALGVISINKNDDGSVEWTLNQNDDYDIYKPSKGDDKSYNEKKFMEDMLKGSYKKYSNKKSKSIIEIETKDGKVKIIIKRKNKYSPSSDLAKLAKITAKGSTRTFISGIQGQLNRIRNDSNLDNDDIKAAVSQMRGVIQSAKCKLKKLDEEELINNMRARAIRRREIEKSRQMTEELKRRRTKRKSNEYAQISQKFYPIGETPRTYREVEERNYLDDIIADTYVPNSPVLSAPAAPAVPSPTVPSTPIVEAAPPAAASVPVNVSV